MSPPEFLTLGDVAANFGWATLFVERLAAAGALPGMQVNGKWQWSAMNTAKSA